jgi:hypothetical protein
MILTTIAVLVALGTGYAIHGKRRSHNTSRAYDRGYRHGQEHVSTKNRKTIDKEWHKKLVEAGHGTYTINTAGDVEFVLHRLMQNNASPRLAPGTEADA